MPKQQAAKTAPGAPNTARIQAGPTTTIKSSGEVDSSENYAADPSPDHGEINISFEADPALEYGLKMKHPAVNIKVLPDRPRYPFQGINNGAKLPMDARASLEFIVHALVRLMRDKMGCTITLKLREDGTFSGCIGLGKMRLRLSTFGVTKNRDSEAGIIARETIKKVLEEK